MFTASFPFYALTKERKKCENGVVSRNSDCLKLSVDAPMSENDSQNPLHFKGRDAISHVAEAQAKGMISAAEIHGTEIPGPLSACADAARDTAFLLMMLSLITYYFSPGTNFAFVLIIFSVGFLVFRAGRSAWLGWFRLERLHRVLEQEKWEIEHNRDQERSELKELYHAKGFEGQLLDDVIDVLMADGDRLLRVMVEEELGLSLENVEHPLKQGLGASIGVLAASIACLAGFFLFGYEGLVTVSVFVIGLSGMLIAWFAKNKLIPAFVWNIAFSIAAYFLILFSLQAIG